MAPKKPKAACKGAQTQLLPNGLLDPNRGAITNTPAAASSPNTQKLIDKAAAAMQFYFNVTDLSWGGVSMQTLTREPLQHAPRVEEVLRQVRLPITAMRFEVSNGRVVPMVRTTERSNAWHEINLYGYDAELKGSPREKVATARRLMIALLTHEVDEWLYTAGLADDPHAQWTQDEHDQINHIFEEGTASL